MSLSKQKSHTKLDKTSNKKNLNSAELKSFFQNCWVYLKEDKLKLFWIVFLALSTLIFRRLHIMGFGWAIDLALQSRSQKGLLMAAGAILFVGLIKSFLFYNFQFLTVQVGLKAVHKIRKKINDTLLKSKVSIFKNYSSGKLITRVSHDTKVLEDFFCSSLTSFPIQILEVFSIAIACLIIHPQLTLISLAIFPVFLKLSLLITEKTKKVHIISKKELSKTNTLAHDIVQGSTQIQSLKSQNPFKEKFESLNQSYTKLQIDTVKLSAKLWPIMDVFQILSLVLCLSTGVYFIKNNSISPGEFTAFILLLRSIFRPTKTAIEEVNKFQNSLTSSTRVFRTLEDLESEEELSLKDNMTLLDTNIALEAHQLFFRYEADSPWLLNNLNFKFEKNKIHIITGRTGAGKTSLTNLIFQYEQAQKGEMKLFGKKIQEIPLHQYRNIVRYQDQDSFLFKGSVLDNIQLLRDKNTEINRLKDKLQITNLLEKEVLENGSNLSSGEIQIISLLRHLCYPPKVLILDEATSQIDSQLKEVIDSIIKELSLKTTLIMITHSETKLFDSSIYYHLDQGQFV